VLKIGVSKINPKLSWIEAIKFWQEFVGIGFANMTQFALITLIQCLQCNLAKHLALKKLDGK